MSTPAYFLSLTVSNFRCFGPEPQTLDLSDGNGNPSQWTILLGENGVGKTTLLQCAVIAPPLQHRFWAVTKNIVSPDINLDSESFTDWINEAKANIKGLGAILVTASQGYRSGVEISKSQDFEISVFFGNNSFSTDSPNAGNAVSKLLCYGYGGTRRMSRNALSERRDDGISATLFDEDAQLINAEEWLLQTDYVANRAGKQNALIAKKRMERIIEILKNVLPDVIDFQFNTSKDGRMTPRFEALTAYGWVRVADLSLGYKTTLAWIVDLAYRLYDHYPDSENPLAEPVVVLVDEIDLHLHPSWQRKLFDYLTVTFPKAQFIVTAHSPLVVQAAPNANLALLRRKGDHVEIVNDIDYVRDWRVDQILTSDLFNQPTAYPPQKEPALLERRRILTQPTLTDGDKARLAELEAEIGALPSGETEAEIRARETIGRAAELLEQIAAKAAPASNGR